jgi:hypothetical protein
MSVAVNMSQLTADRTPRDEGPASEDCYAAQASWLPARQPLDRAQADTLLILDCCCAGNVIKGSMTEDTRAYELMAATGRNETTPQPGEKSYTHALIRALKELRGVEHGFSTFELDQRIKKYRKDEHPSHLSSELPGRTRHICLAPPACPNPRLVPQPVRGGGSLNLRMSFSDHNTLSDEEVKKLARRITKASKDVAKETSLKVCEIEWAGFVPRKSSARFRQLVQMVMKEPLLSGAKTRFRLKRQKRSWDVMSDEGVSSKRQKESSHLKPSASGPSINTVSLERPLTPGDSNGEEGQ